MHKIYTLWTGHTQAANCGLISYDLLQELTYALHWQPGDPTCHHVLYAGHWPQSTSIPDFEVRIRKFVETQSINKEAQLGILPINFSFLLFLCMSVCMVIFVHVFSSEYACKGMFK